MWRERHRDVMREFLCTLNACTDNFVLKGGTALLFGYGLDRFSEDLDFDGFSSEITNIVQSFCQVNKYAVRCAKNTPTVKRYFIHYGDVSHPLKVEVSYRTRDKDPQFYCVRNGVLMYTIDALCFRKINAYNHRDKLRDAYDISFIYANYRSELSQTTLAILKDALAYKGLEQFDYLVQTQHDSLIDEDRLSEMFLEMFDSIGLLRDESSDSRHSHPDGISEFKLNERSD